MSRNSQAKRAARAKSRARQRARDAARSRVGGGRGQHDPRLDPYGGMFGRAPDDDSYAEDYPAFEREFEDDNWAYEDPYRTAPSSLDPRAAARELIRTGHALGLRAVAALQQLDTTIVKDEAAATLDELVRGRYGTGWLPDELVRVARLKGDATLAGLARWVIGAERATRTGERIEPEWQSHWERAEPVTVPDEQWLSRWGQWQGSPDHPAELRALLHLVHIWQYLPQLETLITPPPGIAPAGRPSGVRHRTETDPLLERVRALLAKAESTEHEAEASSFTAKAHELMTKYAIDEALLESDAPSADAPGAIRLPLDPPYADAKALLLQTVATSMRCRTLYLKEFQLSTVVGFASDLDGVELLFTSLLVQSHHALTEAISGARPGSHQRSQSFKAAFLSGFTERIGHRLTESNRLAYADDRAETFLPVLQSREEKVERMIEERFGGTTSHAVRGGYSYEGYHHGRQAGDAARLSSGAVER